MNTQSDILEINIRKDHKPSIRDIKIPEYKKGPWIPPVEVRVGGVISSPVSELKFFKWCLYKGSDDQEYFIFDIFHTHMRVVNIKDFKVSICNIDGYEEHNFFKLTKLKSKLERSSKFESQDCLCGLPVEPCPEILPLDVFQNREGDKILILRSCVNTKCPEEEYPLLGFNISDSRVPANQEQNLYSVYTSCGSYIHHHQDKRDLCNLYGRLQEV